MNEHRIELSKHLVNFYKGDMGRLKDLYPGGAAIIIRKLIRLHLQKVEAKVIERLSEKEMEE